MENRIASTKPNANREDPHCSAEHGGSPPKPWNPSRFNKLALKSRKQGSIKQRRSTCNGRSLFHFQHCNLAATTWVGWIGMVGLVALLPIAFAMTCWRTAWPATKGTWEVSSFLPMHRSFENYYLIDAWKFWLGNGFRYTTRNWFSGSYVMLTLLPLPCVEPAWRCEHTEERGSETQAPRQHHKQTENYLENYLFCWVLLGNQITFHKNSWLPEMFIS